MVFLKCFSTVLWLTQSATCTVIQAINGDSKMEKWTHTNFLPFFNFLSFAAAAISLQVLPGASLSPVGFLSFWISSSTYRSVSTVFCASSSGASPCNITRKTDEGLHNKYKINGTYKLYIMNIHIWHWPFPTYLYKVKTCKNPIYLQFNSSILFHLHVIVFIFHAFWKLWDVINNIWTDK